MEATTNLRKVIPISELEHALWLDRWYSAGGERNRSGYSPLPNELADLQRVQDFLRNDCTPCRFHRNWPAMFIGVLFVSGRLRAYENAESAKSDSRHSLEPVPREYINKWNRHLQYADEKSRHETEIAFRADELEQCLIQLRLPLPTRLFPDSEMNTERCIEQDEAEYAFWFERFAKAGELEKKKMAHEKDLAIGRYTDRLAVVRVINELAHEIEKLRGEDPADPQQEAPVREGGQQDEAALRGEQQENAILKVIKAKELDPMRITTEQKSAIKMDVKTNPDTTELFKAETAFQNTWSRLSKDEKVSHKFRASYAHRGR